MGCGSITQGVTGGRGLSPGLMSGTQICLALLMVLVAASQAETGGKFGYFAQENNSVVLIRNAEVDVTLNGHLTEFSFRTCSNGEFLYQRGALGDNLILSMHNGSILLLWGVGTESDFISVGHGMNNDEWWTVGIQGYLGNLYLNVSQGGKVHFSEIIYNLSSRTYFSNMDFSGTEGLYVGKGFTGCVMEGPTVIFSNYNINRESVNVTWSNTSCPHHDVSCAIENGDIDDCYNHPCMHGGTCIDGINSYTCTCAHLYNGTNCENDLSQYGCAVSPCLNDGTCQDTTGNRPYNCLCPTGFVGINCEGNVDECGTNPCRNGVPCIDTVGGYVCNCTGSGYNGTRCDEDIDECLQSGICGQGTCFNKPGGFTCDCPIGYIGPQCQDIQECLSDPCQNGGTCLDKLNEFQCACVAGFTGIMCETDIDNCVNVTCSYPHTECRDLVNNHECVCKPGYRGNQDNCVEINECTELDPCRNGATCQDRINDYTCVCVPGYVDKNCSTDFNECAANPCRNGATCIDEVNSYSCYCVTGFDGTQCQNNIDECGQFSEPCFNGGSCIDGIGEFTCDCLLGYSGDRCQLDIDECASNPCGTNSITCTHGIGYYNCTCKQGYTGNQCQIDINECSSNPCKNGATCNDEVNGYSCDCTPQWMGSLCSIPYNACSPDFQNCKNGATCQTTLQSRDFNCTCIEGFTGSQCETNIQDCLPDSCVPPLVCFDGINEYNCACPNGYHGADCSEEILECASSPCQNGATCIEGIGNYTCECVQRNFTVPDGNGNRTYLSGYEGRNCERDIDECAIQPSICLNGGDCQNEDGAFQCKCGRDVDGNYYPGTHCEVTTTYCVIAPEVQLDPPACKNNGTCKGLISDFSCTCAPGFEGRRCKTNIDECEPEPCAYNGTCIDGINGYTCECIPGITGENCTINIDECASNPCLHGGQCIDHINSFECDCTDTGFKGDVCEIDIDDCESQPCLNGATCYDKIKDFNCSCNNGYNGKQCQFDINECLSTPCYYGSTCLEKSNQTLYDIGHPGFEGDFSYFNASGYICECVAGSTGVNCEVNIDDCQHENCVNGATCVDELNKYRCECAPGYEAFYCQTEIDECQRYTPCQYGSTCTDRVADYDCDCPPLYNSKPYAGKNCTFELTSCINNECHNGATCQPYLINEASAIQDYDCLCTTGFTGRYCNISTTMSFINSSSNIQSTLNITPNESISFRFRTTLSNAILFGWIGQLNSLTRLFATVELIDGLLYLGYRDSGSELLNMSVSDLVLNDANWHSVEFTKTNDSVSVTLSDSQCTSSDCTVSAMYGSNVLVTKNGYFGSFGDAQKSLVRQTLSKSEFVGCMQDVTIHDTRLALDFSSEHTLTSMGVGCPRTQQCHKDTCSMKGDCVDLWNNFQCNCYRPALGRTCETGYVAATFSHQDITSSTATFDLSSDIASTYQRQFDFSFFFRTRQANSKILFFGNRLDNTYLTLALQDGNLEIIINFCSSPKTLVTNGDIFSDGNQHLIHYHRNGDLFEIYVDNVKEYSETLSPSCSFQSSYVYFGGSLPPANRRRKRETVVVTDGESISDFINKDFYKGTIQDVQLGTMSLQFYALPDPTLSDLIPVPASSTNGLTQDEVTDPVCDMMTPCENNSTCSNVFFNDYSCDCLLGYRGKNCSELDFCITGKCPDGSECQSLLDGFECISNATFDGQSDFAIYKNTLGNSSVISAFSFKFRTLAMNGYVLMFGDNNQFFKVRMVGSDITVEYKLEGADTVVLTAGYVISNSRLYMAEVKEHENDITLTLFDPEKVTEYATVNGTKPMSTKNYINDILKKTNTDIILGNRVSGVNVPANIFAYHGCLSEVRIGGILLPFYTDDQFINNTSKERFLLQPIHRFTPGCQAGIGCLSNQCQHSSNCVPDFYSYICECPPGYTGRWCQDLMDYCDADPCVNGYCVSNRTMDMYECHCDNTGYTGTRCDTDIDECSTNGTPCLNNGSCQNENGTFSCTCTASFLGDTCEIQVGDNCSSSPCVHGTCTDVSLPHPDITPETVVDTYQCTCLPGYTGYRCNITIDYCANNPCDNGGNCTSRTATQDYSCACPSGFTGVNCQININDCPDNACMHGGQCIDGVNTYTCNCTQYYEGANCSIEVDDCARTQQCQNSGICYNIPDGPASCNCARTGYEGLYCEVDIDECQLTDTCKNGASCTNTDGGYICNCTLGYEGQDCGTPNCDLVDCKNGATCSISNQQWTCVCPQYYEGQLCGIKGPCADDPCVNANTERCSQNITDNTYTCHCKPGWEGQQCNEDVDECQRGLDQCRNAATCLNIDGSYTCQCANGYTDTYCNTDINECTSNPCQNNGICLDQIGKFECNCTNTGYTNETCSDDIDECSVNNPCYNSGTCTNTVGSFQCACTDGWEGPTCQTKAEAEMDEDITWYIVGPVVGLVLILITVGIIWFLFCVRNKRATRGAYSPSRQEVTGSRVELGNVMKKPPLERLI